jgi:hypothetical protein
MLVARPTSCNWFVMSWFVGISILITRAPYAVLRRQCGPSLLILHSLSMNDVLANYLQVSWTHVSQFQPVQYEM